jgi:DNA helicase HerA-like ATPase
LTNGNNVIGVFIGLESSSYEYIANIIAPYHSNFTLEIGDFLLIEDLGNFLVSRVTEYRPTGELTAFMGQKWLGDVAYDLDAIGMDIKEKKIRYTVRIKILGSLSDQKFSPGLRKIPHITSKVYKPDIGQLSSIISTANSLQAKGQEIGSLYSSHSIRIKFDETQLNSKRTFIFARAGYGKSNLMKLISSQWPKGSGGLLVFDPEGEYATTDSKGRPGILDKREAILVTNRNMSPELGNVYRYLKVNLKSFPPEFVVPILVNETKHETIFFSKLMSLEQESWGKLVDLLYEKGWRADLSEISQIITGGSDNDSKDFQPILNNLVTPIKKIHDPASNLIEIITQAFREDDLIIVDISLLDSRTALQISSLIVKAIFDHNLRNFTGEQRDIIKATFVVEEAQSVIGADSNYASFVELAKEGRKYSLGGIFITQQPGSIPFEILSQADNFFVFHLLSRVDLESLRKANAHYSEDIITQILSEPTKGKCYMWTSEQPFVLPVMIDNFEDNATPNKSIETQAKSGLLNDIIGKVRSNANDPIMAQILSKFIEVEAEMKGKEDGEKTVELYKRLSDQEREYLDKKGLIQIRKSDGKPFAVKTSYYNSLRK